MTGVAVLEISPEDYSAVVSLVQKTTRSTFVGNYPEAVVEHKATSFTKELLLERLKQGYYFVAKLDGNIVGVIGLIENELKTFFVDESYHGNKIGKKLFQKIEAIARQQNYKKIWVKSSVQAIPIYEKLGFVIIKQYKKVAVGHEYTSTLMEKEL